MDIHTNVYRKRIYLFIFFVLFIFIGCSSQPPFGPKEVKQMQSSLKVKIKEAKHIALNETYDIVTSGSYAYLASGSEGLKVINISDPLNPNEVGRFDTPGRVSCIAVLDSLAYIADSVYGIRIINISNPASLSEIGKYNMTTAFYDIAIADSYVYVTSDSGIHIIDFANFAAPYEVGRYTLGCNFGYHYYAIAINKPYIYSANTSCKIVILDVSTPSSPQVMADYIPVKSGTYYDLGNSWGVIFSSPYIYVTGTYLREYDDPVGGFWIIDVSNPLSPKKVGSYETNEISQCLWIEKSGNYVYTVDYYAFRIVDISNLSAPREIAFCELPNPGIRASIIGNYAYVVMSDNGGLQIIDTRVKL